MIAIFAKRLKISLIGRIKDKVPNYSKINVLALIGTQPILLTFNKIFGKLSKALVQIEINLYQYD